MQCISTLTDDADMYASEEIVIPQNTYIRLSSMFEDLEGEELSFAQHLIQIWEKYFHHIIESVF